MKGSLPRILIVDDAPINIQVLNEALQDEYRTCFATSGADALAVAAQVRPDLILLDIMMPGMDGYEVCRRLKADANLATIPVIFITALVQEESEAVGLELGAVDYIPKPFNPALVRLRVKNQLELKCQRDLLQQLNLALEERVQQRTASLANAVQELESFCYAISHDLRAPLRHINAYSAMLVEQCGPAMNDACRSDLSRLGAAAIRMGMLVDALLSMPRLCRREICHEAVDLSALAREIMDGLRRTAPERAAEVTIADDLLVTGDPALLKVALEQLLENAWKFSIGREPARIDFARELVAGRPVYAIRDNGAGFDMDYSNKLFGIFQRLHLESEFAGLGIGLATVQRIIGSHGGEIWAEGTVGGGAIFRFTLDGPRPQPAMEKVEA